MVMLENEEIKTLIHKAQAGDQIAKTTLLEHNLNLVRSVVYRFTNRGYEWDDLFQIGCIGLMKSIERFDMTYSVQFSTYAVPMIIGEIRRFMRDDHPVKVSRPVKELAYRVHRTQEKLQGLLGREPTITEISTDLVLAPQEIVAAIEAIQTPASLYASTYRNNGDSILLVDQIKCSDEKDNAYFDGLALKEILARLPEKEGRVIHLRFFEDRTQAEIGVIIGLSQVQVSRIEKQALKLIREYMQTL